jgi:hypothetical protein
VGTVTRPSAAAALRGSGSPIAKSGGSCTERTGAFRVESNREEEGRTAAHRRPRAEENRGDGEPFVVERKYDLEMGALLLIAKGAGWGSRGPPFARTVSSGGSRRGTMAPTVLDRGTGG